MGHIPDHTRVSGKLDRLLYLEITDKEVRGKSTKIENPKSGNFSHLNELIMMSHYDVTISEHFGKVCPGAHRISFYSPCRNALLATSVASIYFPTECDCIPDITKQETIIMQYVHTY